MKNLFPKKQQSAIIITIMAAMALMPCREAQAQTSRNFGRAITKAVKGNKKELPSLTPQKDAPMPTFSGPKVKMPNAQQKKNSAPPTGVALGYGNSLLFKDMDKMKKDSLKRDTTETRQ